ncbi:MAG: internal scaffolding protein [Microviridae sp.]|nr:MAG: internal scaffolding protein [Microviridae sp.]
MSSNPNNPRVLTEQTSLPISNYNKKPRVSISFPDYSPFTKQEFKDECDINVLMSRYINNGQMPIINQSAPQYLDVTGLEYQNSMEFIAGAKTLFNELPSSLRNRFKNDPAEFLDFCSNEKNRPEMAALGLMKPESEWVVPLSSIQPKTDPSTSNLDE